PPPEKTVVRGGKPRADTLSQFPAILLDRPRHADIIAAVRKTGAAVSLISDGDVAGVIHCAEPKTGIDIYLGTGGAPEGVLAAAALRCIGGGEEARAVIGTRGARGRPKEVGDSDPQKVYENGENVEGGGLV